VGLIVPALIAPLGVFAQTDARRAAAFPDLAADPRAGELAGRAADCRWQDLIDIALWASGASAPNQTEPLYREIIRAAAEELRRSPELPRDARERGEYVLAFTHRTFLKRYVENQTRLDELLTSGRYNCVSSAVLYAIFALAADLDVQGVMTRDHAFATINTGTEIIDVETTNPYGFDPGSRREFHDAFGRLTGFSYVPSRNYRDRTGISLLELCSLILSNRIADLERRNRFEEAVPLAINRAALLANRRDPVSSPFFQDGEKDLLDRLYNYGGWLINSGREIDALAWAEYAGARYSGGDSGEKRWLELQFMALNNYAARLMRANRIADARAALDQYGAALAPPDYARLDSLLLDAELVTMANGLASGGDIAGVLAALDTAARESRLPAARISELRNNVLINEGNRLAQTPAGARAAIAFIETAIARYGGSARLTEALRVHRQNRIADLHNGFARLFNRGDYGEALSHIQEALAEFPGNRQLQQDLSAAERASRR
jgi:tetratricopeptide (TPR) repeat protein